VAAISCGQLLRIDDDVIHGSFGGLAHLQNHTIFLKKWYRAMKQQKRNFQIIYNGSLENLDEDLVYEQSFFKMTPEDRLKASWEMVVHAWELKDKSENELRLNRTTSILKRV